MHVKISSAKWRPFCPGGDELTSAYFRNASLLIWSSSSPSASQGAWLMARNLSLHSFNRGSPFCKPILRRAWKYITMTSYERRDVSNQRQSGCSINRLFKLTTKLTEFHTAGLCDGIHWWLITYSLQQVTLNWLQLHRLYVPKYDTSYRLQTASTLGLTFQNLNTETVPRWFAKRSARAKSISCGFSTWWSWISLQRAKLAHQQDSYHSMIKLIWMMDIE